MEKLAALVIFASFIALSCPFPSKEQDSLENEWLESAMMSRREELEGERENDEFQLKDAELVTRSKVFCAELGLLKHYDVDLEHSHIDCNSVTKKRAANVFAREFKKREYDYEMARKARNEFGACCSPDCDWLLDYLEIDSTVVKCLDRK